MATKKELKVTFVSHACLKIEGEFGTLVCDPWILNEPVFNFTTWKFPAAVMKPREVVEGADYLLITHCHEDHFHAPSIDHFPRDIKILLPAYDNHPSLRAQTVERMLRAMGFYDIRKFKGWERFHLDEHTPLTFIPSATNRDHDWENCGFAIEHHDCTFLNMNDNLTDRELCMKINRMFPHVDIAFIQSVGVSMFPGCFRMSEEEMRVASSQRKHSMEDQRRMIEWIRPKRIVPFAGDFCWLDPKYFHNNWANRATPQLFVDIVNADYPEIDLEIINFHPSDSWTMASGVKRNHPPVDWNNYLDEIKKLQQRFMPKIESINKWIEDSSRHDLLRRSKERTALVEREITRDYIFFEGRFRIFIEGPNSNFSFVSKVTLKDGFSLDWEDQGDVDQTLYIPEGHWAALLEGKLMWNIIQWCSQAVQHKPYRIDMGRFFFWLENEIDLCNRIPQVIIEPRLLPFLEKTVRPQLGVFPLKDELE